MAETRQQALARARKLLALGQSANEHEAANALAAAQRIIDQWRLEQVLLESDAEAAEENEPIQGWDEPLDSSTQRITWKAQLAVVLGHHNGCEVYWAGRRAGGRRFRDLKLVGRGSDVATVRYLYDYCVREIDRLARRHHGKGRTWLNNYRLGAVEAVQQKLREMRAAEVERLERTSDGVSIARVREALARMDAQYLEAQRWARAHFDLRQPTRPSFRGHAEAHRQGRRDGRAISLDRGGASGSDRRRLKS